MKKLISMGFGVLMLAGTLAVGSQSAIAKVNSTKSSQRAEMKLNHRRHHRRERRRWRRMHRRTRQSY